ncbi:MAG: hypothetical protein AUH30_08495 [Candidatus Rokubacteria bacterium 13_1_40CM_68_15]|nr:MAG: hypothetical protein AUH30_08495 [Candidatus Rokubacteria bacterium 13_1_40CM_68_15]
MSHHLVVIAAAVFSVAGFVGAASANVGPSAAGGGQTQIITPPKASTLVAPNILPRLLVTSLPTR